MAGLNSQFGDLFGQTTPTPPGHSAPGRVVTQFVPVNSTTYIDLAGVVMGLTRATGESSSHFAARLLEASRSDRGPTYLGMLNDLRLRLGLEFQQAIAVSGSAPFTLDCSMAGVRVATATASYAVPLLETDPDGVWVWHQMSEIAGAIAALPGFTASLDGDDGPALQLCKQSNTLLAVGEPVTGSAIRLAHAGIVEGSELFSVRVPSYRFSADGGTIFFSQPAPPSTTITYLYRPSPFYLISCPAALVSLLDPGLAAAAAAPGGTLAYQVKEFIWAVAATDLSYWAQ